MICERPPAPGPEEDYIEIIELNHRTRRSEARLLQLLCPETPPAEEFPLGAPIILGNVAAVCISAHAHGDEYLVMDWKSQIAFAVQARGALLMHMEILPGYLVVQTEDMQHDDIASCDLHLISISAALLSHGTPVDSHTGAPFNTVPLEQLPKILARNTEPRTEGPLVSWQRFGKLSVHRSPLRRDIYRIWVYDSHGDPDCVLHSLDLVLLPGNTPSWHERTRVPAWAHYSRRIGYSGHTMSFEATEGRLVGQIVPPVFTPL
ncbi:hypothetical protein B0H16DRAFT_1897479 [Mycena metata]|uniref:Uncharacterized protein n=1 Tax=Mycena metata TaxID=1033252 RepID=A0AAD7MIA4_9AGAR|nr:hypothetical protein B0H16DRAFT_1897479 [Mycena metata]